MKITDIHLTIVDGKLTIEGKGIEGLFADAKNEPTLRRHAEVTASLPPEDLLPGHVMPASILTTSRSC